MYADAIVFSGEEIEAGRKIWTNSKEPMRLKPGVSGGPYVSMFGAASASDGVLHYETKVGAGIRKEDIVPFLAKLKRYYGKHKLAIFLDNGSSNKALMVKHAAADLGIVLIYDVPYRPDLNVLENVWVHLKNNYRYKKTRYLMAGQSWNNDKVVKECISELD